MQFGYHHTALSVDALDASAQFYSNFGFREAHRYDDPNGNFSIVQMLLGGAMLELFWFRERVPAPSSAAELSTDLPRIGAKHFGLRVESVEEARRFVEERGIGAPGSIQQGKTGVRYFFIKDPSGNFLEIIEDNRTL